MNRVRMGQDPLKKRRSVVHIDDATIVRMIMHIFSCCQTLSWGTKKLRENGSNEDVEFPKLTRTLDIESMARDFARKEAQLKAIQWNEEDDPPLHRSVYFEVCSVLTSKAEKSMSCIDYVQDILINVRMTGLVTIIDDVVKEHLRNVEHFLKYQYDGHLSNDDLICSHNIPYALGLKPKNKEAMKGVEHCPGCNFVECFMQKELREAVSSNRSRANSESVDDALAYIEDSLECFHRYQQHRVRVVNQQLAISEMHENVKKQVKRFRKHGKRGTTIIVTLDFKQKYLEKRLRSSQMNDFGQRGITWHIVVIEYYVYEEPSAANGFKGEAKRVQVPLDQILNSGNRQDGPCVLAMLEAVMKFIQSELDFAKEVILVSDNANCYHSKEMIFSICLLNQLLGSKGPKIVKYIHPETQDGKGLCDSHAAVAARWVDIHFICNREDGTLTYNEACTPRDVATALCSDGGVKNSAVQLIKLDFPRLEQISKLCSGAGDEAKEYFSRANEVRFFPYLDELSSWASLDLTEERNWSEMAPLIQVINYSNVSEGSVFKVGFKDWENGEGTFEPVVSPDQDPKWHARMATSLVTSRLVHDLVGQVMTNFASRLSFAHAQGLISTSEASGAFSSQDFSEEDDEEIGNDNDLSGLIDDDDDEDEFDEHECFESFFQIEHSMAQTVNDDDFDEEDFEDEKEHGEEEVTADEVNSGGDAKPSALRDPPARHYNKERFFTRVEVEKYKPLGKLLPTETNSTKERGKRMLKEEEKYTSKKARDRAIRFAPTYIGQYSIKPAMEEDMETYKIAHNWVPSSPIWGPGWARRPTSGLYGKNYMNKKFRETCVTQFKRGQQNKGDKQSPSQTLEIIKDKNPGVYRLLRERRVSGEKRVLRRLWMLL